MSRPRLYLVSRPRLVLIGAALLLAALSGWLLMSRAASAAPPLRVAGNPRLAHPLLSA